MEVTVQEIPMTLTQARERTDQHFKEFAKELEQVINFHCIDNECNTHDFVLADLVVDMLQGLKKRNDRERVLSNSEVYRPAGQHSENV